MEVTLLIICSQLVMFLCLAYTARNKGEGPLETWDDETWLSAIILSIIPLFGLLYLATKWGNKFVKAWEEFGKILTKERK